MKTMKTLMLTAVTAVTALTLGAGAAMAQEQGGPSFAPTTWSAPALAGTTGPAASQANQSQPIQFGSSDAAHDEDAGMRAYERYNAYPGA